MFYKKITAFTLAEVLLTLMIIGVIAVVTIPTLKESADKSANLSLLQKAYSVSGKTQSFLLPFGQKTSCSFHNSYSPFGGNSYSQQQKTFRTERHVKPLQNGRPHKRRYNSCHKYFGLQSYKLACYRRQNCRRSPAKRRRTSPSYTRFLFFHFKIHSFIKKTA